MSLTINSDRMNKKLWVEENYVDVLIVIVNFMNYTVSCILRPCTIIWICFFLMMTYTI